MFIRILAFFITTSLASAIVFGLNVHWGEMELGEAVSRGVGLTCGMVLSYAWGYYTCVRDTVKELNW